MKLLRIQIRNFRNFKSVDVTLGNQIVILGENKIGKTNFLHALRIVLDPSLPDSARRLQSSDFWDGLPRPLTKRHHIKVSVDITDFDDNTSLLAVLCDHLVQAEPMIARLNYEYRPKVNNPRKESDYEFVLYGGDNDTGSSFGYDVRKWIPMEVLPALRDAESSLGNWRSSPLRPLLDRAIANIEPDILIAIAEEITKASSALTEIDEINNLAINIETRLLEMVGVAHSLDAALGLSSTEPSRLARSIRILIDSGKRGISDASLGCANLLLLALKSLELRQLVTENNRSHTLFAIEEPEAHLHPHLQRLVYRDFLRVREGAVGKDSAGGIIDSVTTILTTHSPHIVSVAPLDSLVLLHKSENESTVAASTASVDFSEDDIHDLERYLDVTRGEILFAKGVILVEGDAERFLIPQLAKSIGRDLDHLGISVCSVAGTNFVPYVKLLCESALDIPFAVVTDWDPQGNINLGTQRVIDILCELISDDDELWDNSPADKWLEEAPNYGVFINDWTFEVALFESGNHIEMGNVLISLTTNKKAQDRACSWMELPENVDYEQMLKDISKIGKGRYAQRLSSTMNTPVCPDYIKEAIEYVTSNCS